MKIVYVITKSEMGGAQSHVLELIKHFSVENEVILVSGEDGYLLHEARNLGIAVYIISSLVAPISFFNDIVFVVQFTRFLNFIKPNLVHLHSSKAGFLGRLACLFANKKAVFTAHGWAFTNGVTGLRKWIAFFSEWLAAFLCESIINVSEFDYKLARSYFVGRKNQHHIVHNGVAEIQIEKNKSTLDEKLKIVMVARFNHPKAQDILIESIPYFDQNVDVTFIGDGPLLGVCQVLAKDLNVTERVTFLGASTFVGDLLPNFDLFVLISHYEGFPISILEAMRAGLPIISSNVGGVSESVVNNENGLLVENTIDSISGAVNKVNFDRNRLISMGEKSNVLFETLFTSKIMLKKINSIYLDVIRH